MSDALLPFVVIGGFLIAFPLMWVAVLTLMAQLSGWARLARTFTDHAPTQPPHFSWRSAQFGWLANYNNCLQIWISPKGIGLKPIWPLGIGHAPLLLPWSAIASLAPSRVLFGTGTIVEVRPGTGAAMRFTIYGKDVVEAVERTAPRSVVRQR